LLTALLNTICSFPHFKHLTLTKLLLGLGISFSHSVTIHPSILSNNQLPQPNSILMPHVTTNLTLQLQSLLLRCLRKLPLKRILLTTITPFLPQAVVALAFSQRPTFPSLIQRDRMSLMLLASRTVRLYFFGNIHLIHDQLCIKKTTRTLILF
jgi:hypothetical protein